MADPELAALPLTTAERSDHVPEMMEELIRRLEGPQEELSDVATDAARKHGKLRYQQGYTIPAGSATCRVSAPRRSRRHLALPEDLPDAGSTLPSFQEHGRFFPPWSREVLPIRDPPSPC